MTFVFTQAGAMNNIVWPVQLSSAHILQLRKHTKHWENTLGVLGWLDFSFLRIAFAETMMSMTMMTTYNDEDEVATNVCL